MVAGPMFNQIGEGRFSAMLARLFRVQGGNAAAPTLAPEVMPVIEVNPIDPTVKYLVGIRRCTYSHTLAAAGAGTFATYEVNNPLNSGMLVTIKRVWVFAASPSWRAYVSRMGTGLPTVATPAFADTRWYGPTITTETPQARVQAQATGAGPADVRVIGLVPPAVGVYDIDVVLDPGSWFGMNAQTANVAGTLGIQWEERKLAPDEQKLG